MPFVDEESCHLCKKTPSPILEEGLRFCCKGCSFVYRVLKGRGIDPSVNDPLFQKAESLGLFSDQEPEKKGGEELRLAFWIEGLFCPACQYLLEHAIKKLNGILSVVIDYTTDLCLIWYQPRFVSTDEIFELISSLGYVPHPLESLDGKGWQKNLLWRVGVASFSTLNVMMASYPLLADGMATDTKWGLFFTLYAFVASLPIPFYAAFPLLKQGVASLLRLSFGVEAFITIAVIGGFVLSLVNLSKGQFELYLDAATLLPTLFLFGKLLESKVKGEARERLLEVARTLPLRGRKIVGDKEAFVPLKELIKGDEILILRGEKVVLDGEITEGEALVDEAIVTGESVPLFRKLGDPIIAGSRLVEGWVKARILKVEAGSTLQTLVSLIEEGLNKKNPYKPFLDRMLTYFVPTTLVLALILFFWRGPLDALSLLLLACPCTLGIALPLARSRLAAKLGEKGLIVRRVEALDLLGQETDLLLDKTGTITEGDSELFFGLDAIPVKEKRALKTLVSYSNHPLCRSVKKYLLDIEEAPLTNIQEIVGKGMQSDECRLGSRVWFEALSMPLPPIKEELELFFERGDKIYPLLFREKIREGIEEWLKTVKEIPTQILSGDRLERVEKIAERVGISSYFGAISPQEKREKVVSLQKEGGRVFFIGDGVNDGPALAAADLSASPEGGQDLTLFVSDLIIRGSFKTLIEARKLGSKTRVIVLQNLALSFGYNGLAILWALFGGGLTPLLSVLVMTASSITVICNALRIK